MEKYEEWDEQSPSQAEELQSDMYEYQMPLSGTSPPPPPFEEEEEDSDEEDDEYPVASRAKRGGWYDDHRRSSIQTDATPIFQNRSQHPEHDEPIRRLPPIPMHVEQSHRSLVSQSTFESSVTGGTGSVTGSHVGRSLNDSVSAFSHSYSANLPSPSSSLVSHTRTPDHTKRSFHQINFDGAVQQIPYSPEPSTVGTNYSSQKHTPTSEKPAERMSAGTAGSLSNNSGSVDRPEPAQEQHDQGSEEGEEVLGPVVCCGLGCPMWISCILRAPPTLNSMSHFVVNIMPCWFCAEVATTDRIVLTRLNILCLFMTTVQLVASAWLSAFILVLDDGEGVVRGFAPHFWNVNGAAISVGFLAGILIATCICTIRVIKEVDLVGAIRYLWVVLWVVPCELFFNISLYDYHHVTRVWIVHWWLEPEMSWFRDYFCDGDTSEGKCLVPLLGGDEFDSEDSWCLAMFNSTDCTDVRNDAQSNMDNTLLDFYTGLGIWTSVLLFLLWLMVNSLERIITKPIVQKSRETNVPAWLALPTAANALVGSVFLYSPSSLMNTAGGSTSSWVGYVFLATAALFLLALLTACFLSTFSIKNSGDKQTKNIAVLLFIGLMVANAVMLAAAFVASILFSAEILFDPIGEAERGEVACDQLDRVEGCTGCDAFLPENRCPEWTTTDVNTILKTQLKQSAALASIFFLYSISMMRYGLTLRGHLRMYEIDYV